MHVYQHNNDGLPVLYNVSLESADENSPILFVHDDVSLQDLFLQEKLNTALHEFDVVGLAGSKAPSDAPGWCGAEWDRSGMVSHADRHIPGSQFRPEMTYFGLSPQACHAIDGLFIACVPRVVKEAGVSFDARFRFHHYDIDFAQQAREKGLRVGTWPIWVAHGSGGDFSSKEWKDSAAKYQQKWRR